MNALAAAAAAKALGFDRQRSRRGSPPSAPFRGGRRSGVWETARFIVMDAYNANPASVREALKTLQELRGTGNAFVDPG